jgi:hypothetical protein
MNEAYPGAAVVDRIEDTFKEMARDVNISSGAARNAWMFFMALLAYFVVALAGITHRDLLLNTPVQLPLLHVSIALRSFFLFGPMILVLIHFGLMLQHAMLARKIHELHDRVRRFEGPGMFRTHRVRVQLHSYHYTQLIAGPYRSRSFAVCLSLMTWLTLVILPVFLLLHFQVTFLPYHDLTVTWAHRLFLVTDLAVIAIMGIFMRYPGKSFVIGFGANMAQRPGGFIGAGLFCMSVVVFAHCIATVPDEIMDRMMATIPGARASVPMGETDSRQQRVAFWPTAVLFEGGVDHLSGRPASFFGRNLVVTDTDLIRDSEIGPGDTSLSLRRRDLRYGTFDRSDLHQADLTGAVLTKASLRETNLIEIKAEKANLQGADLWRAQFLPQISQGRVMNGADLREADLRRANLQQANMQGAEMTGALLEGAELTGALLDPEDAAEARRQGGRF